MEPYTEKLEDLGTTGTTCSKNLYRSRLTDRSVIPFAQHWNKVNKNKYLWFCKIKLLLISWKYFPGSNVKYRWSHGIKIHVLYYFSIFTLWRLHIDTLTHTLVFYKKVLWKTMSIHKEFYWYPPFSMMTLKWPWSQRATTLKVTEVFRS